MVPVWINVRQDPIPDLPERQDILLGARIDEDGRIVDLGSKGFFLRVLVLDPHDLSLLNRQEDTAAGSVAQLGREGAFSYAQQQPRGVRPMLEAALGTYAERRR